MRVPLKIASLLALMLTPETDASVVRSTPPLQCLKTANPAALPSSLPVGVETIHRDTEKVITIFVPLALAGTPSRVLDSNSKRPAPSDKIPTRFVMSDGSVRTAFVGVDARPGQRLDACIAEILDRLPSKKPEAILTFIQTQLQDQYLKKPQIKGYVFPWDKDRKGASETLMEVFYSAKDVPVGQYPIRSKDSNGVVPLENFLQLGYGTCLHKALLASLILSKAGIGHRLVNGASKATGHTWIQLEDGRILDPSFKKLEKPKPSKAFEGWYKYGDNLVFENQVWPYLALD